MLDRALMLFGERLRAERIRKMLNQEEFSKLGSVSQNSQLAYEKGKTSPPVEYLLRLADHDVDIGYILTGRRNGGEADGMVEIIADLIMRLSAREREAILANVSVLTGNVTTTADLAGQRDLGQHHRTMHEQRLEFRGAPATSNDREDR